MRFRKLIYILLIPALCHVGTAAAKPDGTSTNLDCDVEQRGWKARECERLAAEQQTTAPTDQTTTTTDQTTATTDQTAVSTDQSTTTTDQSTTTTDQSTTTTDQTASSVDQTTSTSTSDQTTTVSQTVLSWSIPTTRQNGELLGASELAGYEIYVTVDGADSDQVIAIDDPLQTSHTLSGLAPGTYHFAVSAVDVGGLHSELSEVVSKTIEADVAAL